LGHSRCGAVSGALGRLQNKVSKKTTEHLDAILNPIEKAIKESGIDVHGTRALEESIQANVKYIANQLISRSDVIPDALKSGQIVIVGSEYFIDTGTVDELFAIPEPITNQSSLVGSSRRKKL
jgi:carbonic anhydrase